MGHYFSYCFWGEYAHVVGSVLEVFGYRTLQLLSSWQKTTKEYRLACELWDLYVEVKNDIISEALGETTRAERRARRKRVYAEEKSDDEDEEEQMDTTADEVI